MVPWGTFFQALEAALSQPLKEDEDSLKLLLSTRYNHHH
jgi:hypothetical protein